ncbi:MAG: hypothetical protein QXP36_02120 [Conexivisphaerales archaeon]
MIVYISDHGGCTYYRLLSPANFLLSKNLVKQIHFSNIYLSAEKIKEMGCNTVHVTRQTEETQIKYLASYKLSSIKIINDIDDLLWDLPDSHPSKKLYTKERIDNLITGLRLSDMVVVSTKFLQKRLKDDFAIDSVVLENFINCSDLVNNCNNIVDAKKLKVCWAGTDTHKADLEIIKDLFFQTKDLFDWTFIGYLPEFIDRSKNIVQYIPYQEPAQYLQLLSTLNINLVVVPLQINDFNKAKSHSKVLEFAAKSIPAITTDIEAYRDTPAYKVKNDVEEWLSALWFYNTHREDLITASFESFEWATNYTFMANINEVLKVWIP